MAARNGCFDCHEPLVFSDPTKVFTVERYGGSAGKVQAVVCAKCYAKSNLGGLPARSRHEVDQVNPAPTLNGVLAAKIREAVQELNEMLADAAERGMRVDITVMDRTRVGHASPCRTVFAEIFQKV